MRKNYAYIQSAYTAWDIINKNNIQAEVSVLKNLKMCVDGTGKIEGFTTNELFNHIRDRLHLIIIIINCF